MQRTHRYWAAATTIIAAGSIGVASPQTRIFYSTRDAEIQEKYPDGNFGTKVVMRVNSFNSSWQGGGDGRGRALVAFDLPVLPPGTTVLDATFELYESDNAYIYPEWFDVFQASGQWDEYTVTWNTQPTPTELLGRMYNAGWQYLPVSGPALNQQVQDWIDGTEPNDGFLVRFRNEYYNGSPNGTRGDSLVARESTVEPIPRLTLLLDTCVPDITTQGAGSSDPDWGVPDGTVTGADLNYYINDWINDTSNADLTTQGAAIGDPGYAVPDGLITGTDISYFVNLWILGCP